MIVLAGAILGALIGGFNARRRKGKPADIALYATVFAIIFALIGLFLSILIERNIA